MSWAAVVRQSQSSLELRATPPVQADAPTLPEEAAHPPKQHQSQPQRRAAAAAPNGKKTNNNNGNNNYNNNNNNSKSTTSRRQQQQIDAAIAQTIAGGGASASGPRSGQTTPPMAPVPPSALGRVAPLKVTYSRAVLSAMRDQFCTQNYFSLHPRADGSAGPEFLATVAAIEGLTDRGAVADAICQPEASEILRRERQLEERFPTDCATCSGVGGGCCDTISELLRTTLREARARQLTFLVQAPSVVLDSLRLEVALESCRVRALNAVAAAQRNSSKRSKKAKKNMQQQQQQPQQQQAAGGGAAAAPVFSLAKLPASIISVVRAFLLPAGFHLAPPKPNTEAGAAAYERFATALAFDHIINNTGPIFTDLGDQWRSSSSAFDKFVDILFWRDEPLPPLGQTLIARPQIPVVVACCAHHGGDLDAALLLAHLGFVVLSPDVLWSLPFLRMDGAAGADAVVRRRTLIHALKYFFQKQFSEMLALRF